MKRVFDIVLSITGLIILSPVFLLLSVWVLSSSAGGVFYRQKRAGRNGLPFMLIKFRTMRPGSDRSGQLTIGERDPRITRAGYFLRRYKLDELPQLINILKGEMSFVGPRPEVPEYTTLYTEDQKKVLKVRPGLTDEASLAYINENEILGKSPDPVKTYVEEIMPAKLRLNLEYLERRTIFSDIGVILRTLSRIFR